MTKLKLFTLITLILTLGCAHSTLLDCFLHNGVPAGNAATIGNETYQNACYRVNGQKSIAKSASHAGQHGIDTSSANPDWFSELNSAADPSCFSGHQSEFGVGGSN